MVLKTLKKPDDPAYMALFDAFHGAIAFTEQETAKQWQIDWHTLTLYKAIIAYNGSIIPGQPEPLAFSSPNEA